MNYEEPTKLIQGINVIGKTIKNLIHDSIIGLLTFDVREEVLLDLKPLNSEVLRNNLNKIIPRGVSCISAGLTEAINLIVKSGGNGDVLLISDGRANLSNKQMGGYEGSIELENELIKIIKSYQNKIRVHSVAIGEDAFTGTLAHISRISKGYYWLKENYNGLFSAPENNLKVLKKCILKVYGAPIELPSAEPSWTKESQFTHVTVVSHNFYQNYLENHKAFLKNPINNRKARTALIDIESDILDKYRERRPKLTKKVRFEEAILLDKSYRSYLNCKKREKVELLIY
jgi:hypothetical protein